jgi:divalent metal cation (Fe/Co/Zn/Cd) transporter
MLSSPHVVDVIHLRTQHFGPEQLLVGAKVVFKSELTFVELADAINEVERRVRDVVPIARPMYIEPDIARTGGASPDDSLSP